MDICVYQLTLDIYEIKEGTPFFFEGQLYMKLNKEYEYNFNNHKDIYNAVNLKNGELKYFDTSQCISIAEVKVVNQGE